MSTNVQMLEVAVDHLEPLLEEVVFVGGATIELWITDPSAPPARATADVDVVVEISTQRDYYRFEKRVRNLGFNNADDSKVICRFRHPETGLILDVLPTKASILGFENRWHLSAARDCFRTRPVRQRAGGSSSRRPGSTRTRR